MDVVFTKKNIPHSTFINTGALATISAFVEKGGFRGSKGMARGLHHFSLAKKSVGMLLSR